MRANVLLLLAVAPLLAACGAQPQPSTAPQGASAGPAMHKEQIGPDYLLVPPSADRGKSPKLQVAGTRYGVVVAVPPGYAAVPKAASADWTVYVSHPAAGKENLLTSSAAHARRLATLPAGQSGVTIMGVTGQYALFAATTGGGRVLELLQVAGSHAGALRTLGPVTSGPGGALAIRGMVYYLGPGGTVHTMNVATGAAETAGTASPPLRWADGALYASGKVIPLAGQKPAPPALPQGFEWIFVGSGATHPIAAVPQGYAVKQIPGGSSRGVSAKDPSDPAVQVTIFENACAGCYNPGFMAQGTNTLSTPIYVGPQTGTTPLGDHGFISVTTGKQGTKVYQLVADYLGGGDLEAAVSVPARDASLAQEILHTVRLPW